MREEKASPYGVPPAMIAETLLPGAEITRSRSSLAKTMRAKVSGERKNIDLHISTSHEMAASGSAFSMLPSGTSKSRGAIAPQEIGRSRLNSSHGYNTFSFF